MALRCHLLGVLEEQHLISLVLPHRLSTEKPMFSELSFKCRSSGSLSSRTLVQASRGSSMTCLLPIKPEKMVGLGIYRSKSKTSSFLGPRPSLNTIRDYTAMATPPPPRSPLPPLPAYFPDGYRRTSAERKTTCPPKRETSVKRSRTVRMVPPSPALSIANLAALNNSQESLSSVYSRSISGESYTSSQPRQRPGVPLNGSRSYSSSSTTTVKRSRLGATRLASHPEETIISADHARMPSESSSSDIDDAATLQRKLPHVKTVSAFGDVATWVSLSQNTISRQARVSKRFTSLKVRRTRDSKAMFQSHVIAALS